MFGDEDDVGTRAPEKTTATASGSVCMRVSFAVRVREDEKQSVCERNKKDLQYPKAEIIQ